MSTLENGLLTVNDIAANTGVDTILVELSDPTTVRVTVNGQTDEWDLALVTDIAIIGGDSADAINLDPRLFFPTDVSGGSGDDTLTLLGEGSWNNVTFTASGVGAGTIERDGVQLVLLRSGGDQ